MTINEQIKILDNKIRSNQAQYDLDRQNAKISALSSGELDKYKYLTGEDLGYKPDVVQKGKLEYSPLGQVFNKGLDSNEKQNGLSKRLKNIEDKTDEQLLAIEDSKDNKDIQLGIKSIDYDIKKSFSTEELDAFKAIVNQEKKIDCKHLNMKPSPKNHFDFRMFKSLKPSFFSIYYGDILIPTIERDQGVLEDIIEKLKKYKPRTEDNVIDKNNVLKNAKNIYDGREIIINAFKNKLFPFYSGSYYEELEEQSSEGENEE